LEATWRYPLLANKLAHRMGRVKKEKTRQAMRSGQPSGRDQAKGKSRLVLPVAGLFPS